MVEETAAGLIDLVDAGAAARTENYEIAAYESLRRMAKGLGEERAVDLLDANLKDEKERCATSRRSRPASATRAGNRPPPPERGTEARLLRVRMRAVRTLRTARPCPARQRSAGQQESSHCPLG